MTGRATMPAMIPVKAVELTVIKNSDVPVKKNAGRIVKLTEIMRITDQEGVFFLKRPSHIKIAPDESIYLIDDKQFLRFDKDGRFLGNLHKVGEGPGEAVYIGDYFFTERGILIFSGQPPKIIDTDLSGNLVKEQMVQSKSGIKKNLGFYNGKYWVASGSFEDFKDNMVGIIDMKLRLGWRTLDGKAHDTDLIFIEKISLNQQRIGEGFRRIMSDLVPAIFALAPDGNLFVSDNRKYSIQRINLQKEIITGRFDRKYSSVPYNSEVDKNEKKLFSQVPSPDFFNDIQKILIHNDNPWIFTSTIAEGKGILVDVFSKDGQYIDCFFLPLPQVNSVRDMQLKQFTVYKDYLVTIEKDKNEDLSLVKYSFEL